MLIYGQTQHQDSTHVANEQDGKTKVVFCGSEMQVCGETLQLCSGVVVTSIDVRLGQALTTMYGNDLPVDVVHEIDQNDQGHDKTINLASQSKCQYFFLGR